MPTYDYQCKNGHVFEIFESIKSEPVAECPTCHESAKRLIGAGSGLMFKGTGFYITDYKKSGNGSNGNGSKVKKKETTNEPKSETKSETKTETETKKE